MKKIIWFLAFLFFLILVEVNADSSANCACGCAPFDEECERACCKSCQSDNSIIPDGVITEEETKETIFYPEERTDRADIILDDFGHSKPIICSCTAMYCFDEPCNTCECSDGKTYESW